MSSPGAAKDTISCVMMEKNACGGVVHLCAVVVLCWDMGVGVERQPQAGS